MNTLSEYEQDYQKRQADELVRRFLKELDACTTEQERIEKVLELVFGVTRAARRESIESWEARREV